MMTFQIEEMVAVLSRLLGRIHGLIGVPQQEIAIRIIVRVACNAHAGGQLEGMTVNVHGASQLVENMPIDPGVLDIAQDGDEFVAAKSGDYVVMPNGAPEAIRDALEDAVTDGMPLAVIDALEAVQIEKAH